MLFVCCLLRVDGLGWRLDRLCCPNSRGHARESVCGRLLFVCVFFIYCSALFATRWFSSPRFVCVCFCFVVSLFCFLSLDPGYWILAWTFYVSHLICSYRPDFDECVVIRMCGVKMRVWVFRIVGYWFFSVTTMLKFLRSLFLIGADEVLRTELQSPTVILITFDWHYDSVRALCSSTAVIYTDPRDPPWMIRALYEPIIRIRSVWAGAWPFALCVTQTALRDMTLCLPHLTFLWLSRISE